MKRIASGLALLAASAAPALAGGDWDDDYEEYERYAYHERGEYRAYHGVPTDHAPYYVPYGYYYADEEPDVYGADCRVERSWRRGRYKEKIECDD